MYVLPATCQRAQYDISSVTDAGPNTHTHHTHTHTHTYIYIYIYSYLNGKVKQSLDIPGGSRRLRLPDFKTVGT